MKPERTPVFAWLLNLLLPGLGHLYWREISFGLFIYLITLIASVLFVVSFFVSLPYYWKVALFGLPILFYLFTFVDLTRTVRQKQNTPGRSGRAFLIFLLVGIVYQLAAPVALGNFALRNLPEPFVLRDSRLSPRYSKGDLLKASRLSYMVKIFVVNRPVLHTLPQRYDVVRFRVGSGGCVTGVVVGLPGEQLEILEGVPVIDGLPDWDARPLGVPALGDWPLTSVSNYSILVATFNLGRVDHVYEVSFGDLIGKVSRLF